jgi:hypothetical protein
MGHVLMNRQGLAVATQLTHATSRAEREAAVGMIRKCEIERGATLVADKGYNAWTFKRGLEQAGVRPHVAMKSEPGRYGLTIRTPEGYVGSRRIRKRIAEIFGCTKTIGGYAKTTFRGKRRVVPGFDIAIAADNLVRLPKPLAGAAA